MQGLVGRPETSETDRCLLRMALGKSWEDIGRDDEAFENYREGKRLKRKLVPFDEAAMTARFEALHRVFTRALLAAWSRDGAEGRGSSSTLPIFVTGFPRSGTTLVEQILASHPQVHGAGELGLLDQVAGSFRAAAAPGLGFPDYLPPLDAAEFRALGEAYVERLGALAPGAPHITDKLLENYLNIGLIHLVLPRGAHHPCPARPAGRLRLLLCHQLLRRPRLYLRSRRARAHLPPLSRADGPLAPSAAARGDAGGAV